MSSNTPLIKMFFILIALSLLLLVSCLVPIRQLTSDGKLVVIPTLETPQTTSLPSPTRTTIFSESIMTASPEPTLTPLPTQTSSPTEVPPVQINAHCSEIEPIVDANFGVANGLLLENLDSLHITILGDEGLNSPFNLLPTNKFSSFPENSPDGHWLAYFSRESVTDPGPITVHVFNPATQQDFDKLFDSNYPINPGPILFWVDTNQIVFTTERREAEFDWVVWNPFNNETKNFSSNLLDSENTIDRFHIGPIIDPQMEQLTYLCEFCGNAEYQVENIATSQKEWVIDLIPEPPYSYYRMIPVWSPGGELLAVGGHRGNKINGLWVFTRHGQIVYDIAIPTDTFDVAILRLAWSPNGQYLAFERRFDLPGGHLGSALSYLDIENGEIFDLCQDLSTIRSKLVWSPDSDKLAYFAGIEGSSQRLTIVDILSGETTHLIDPEGYYILTGWMDLTQ